MLIPDILPQSGFQRQLPIVTQIAFLQKSYPAEDYHQDYYRNNTHAPYCMMVITPKLKKLEAKGVIK